MSDSSPRGALDALLSRTVSFAGRELALTCGAVMAVESLAPAEAKNERFVSWTMLAVSDLGYAKSLPALRSERGVLPLVLAWAGNLSDIEREESLKIAARLVALYEGSRCIYRASGAEETQVECGNAAMNAGFFMREYGIDFEEYFDMPATRANALYAAWCDANGLQGEDTFWSREKLAGAPAMFAKLNFDYVLKREK